MIPCTSENEDKSTYVRTIFWSGREREQCPSNMLAGGHFGVLTGMSEMYMLYSKTNKKALEYQDRIRTTFSYVKCYKLICIGRMTILYF